MKEKIMLWYNYDVLSHYKFYKNWNYEIKKLFFLDVSNDS